MEISSHLLQHDILKNVFRHCIDRNLKTTNTEFIKYALIAWMRAWINTAGDSYTLNAECQAPFFCHPSPIVQGQFEVRYI